MPKDVTDLIQLVSKGDKSSHIHSNSRYKYRYNYNSGSQYHSLKVQNESILTILKYNRAEIQKWYLNDLTKIFTYFEYNFAHSVGIINHSNSSKARNNIKNNVVNHNVMNQDVNHNTINCYSARVVLQRGINNWSVILSYPYSHELDYSNQKHNDDFFYSNSKTKYGFLASFLLYFIKLPYKSHQEVIEHFVKYHSIDTVMMTRAQCIKMSWLRNLPINWIYSMINREILSFYKNPHSQEKEFICKTWLESVIQLISQKGANQISKNGNLRNKFGILSSKTIQHCLNFQRWESIMKERIKRMPLQYQIIISLLIKLEKFSQRITSNFRNTIIFLVILIALILLLIICK